MSNIVIAIDSSSTKSGVAIYKDNKLIHHDTIIHKHLQSKNMWGLWNKPLCAFVKNLIFEIGVDNNVLIAIESPFGAYSKNMHTFGVLKEMSGIWLGSLMHELTKLTKNITVINMQANNWRSKYGFNSMKRDQVKRACVKLVKQIYNIDLKKIKTTKYNEKLNKLIECEIDGDDAAEAILIGREFINEV